MDPPFLANNTRYENFCFSFSCALLMFIQVREELAMTDMGGKWLNLSKRTAYICELLLCLLLLSLYARLYTSGWLK